MCEQESSFVFVCMYNVSVLVCVTSYKQNSYFLFVFFWCEKSCLCVLPFGLVLGFRVLFVCLFVVVFKDLFGGNEDPNATFLAEISYCKLA
jgi:hypothetical protein